MKKICTPNEFETKKLKEIWKICFNESDEYIEWFFKALYVPENTFCLKSDGEIVSMLMVFRHNYALRGKNLSSAYIGGVSTLPSFRGEGNITRLMESCLKKAVQTGFDIASLIPVDELFYKQYGFETVSDMYVYGGASKHLPACESNVGKLSFEQIYRSFCKNYNFYECRDTESFSLISEEAAAVGNSIYKADDGYIVYSEKDKVMDCREFVYANEAAAKNLTKFIKENSDEFTVRGDASLSSLFGFEVKREPYMMVKVLKDDLKIAKNTENFFNMTVWT